MNSTNQTSSVADQHRRPAARGVCAIFSRPAGHLFLILLIGIISYANSFRVPFLFDDLGSIVDNPIIQNLGNFFQDGSGYSYNPRRYIGYLSFALNYRLGGLDVTGYHAVNLAVHLVNALLVYALTRLTLQTPVFDVQRSTPNAQSLTPGSQVPALGFIPLFAALLFVAHPVETQAVTYIVQRLTSLMALFYLLALVLYARLRLFEEAGRGPRAAIPGLYLLTLVAVVLAMKTKENAFTLPVAIALYEAMFFRGSVRKRVARLLPLAATLAIIPLSMAGQAGPAGALLSTVNEASRTSVETMPRLDYLFTQFRVIVTYLRLLLLPVNQRLDYDYPLYHSLFDPPVLASFLLLSALFGLALYFLYRSTLNLQPSTINSQLTFRLTAFGIFWFFLTLSVESSIIPIDDVIFEHRLYLPSVGFLIALVTGLFALTHTSRARAPLVANLVPAVFALVVLILAGATLARNNVWQDPLSIWRDTAAKSPNSVRALNNYATALTDAGRPDEAFPLLEKALSINPGYAEAYNNLGRAYLSKRQHPDAAVAAFARAIAIQPDFIIAYGNLGAAYNLQGRFEETVRLLRTVEVATAGHVDVYLNLGAAHAQLGNVNEARKYVELARRLNPGKAQELEDFIHTLQGR